MLSRTQTWAVGAENSRILGLQNVGKEGGGTYLLEAHGLLMLWVRVQLKEGQSGAWV